MLGQASLEPLFGGLTVWFGEPDCGRTLELWAGEDTEGELNKLSCELGR